MLFWPRGGRVYTSHMTLPHGPGDPYQYPFGTVQHYYGDIVRVLFVAVAIMTGVAVPFIGNVLAGAYVGAPAIVALLVLAGLTNPLGRTVLVLDAIVSGFGVILTQLVAIAAFSNGLFPLFAFLEFMSFLLMVALYFSVKTVRAMMAHKIGRPDRTDDFDRM